MIPLSLNLKSKSGVSKKFGVEVFSNRITTPRYLYLLIRMLMKNAVSDVADVAIKAKVNMKFEGISDITFTDYFTSETGAAYGFSPMMTRGFRVLNFLLRNAYKRLSLKKMEVDVDLRYVLQKALIYSVKVPRAEVEPGATVKLTVRLKKWLGGFYEKTIPVKIPDFPDNALVRIRVQAGDDVTPDHAPPESLRDVLRYVKKTMSARQLVVSVRTASEGSSARGRLLEDLPGSVVDTLRTATHSVTRKRFTRVWRKAVWDTNVLLGSEKIVLRVKKDPS